MLKTDITVLMVVRNEEKWVGATIRSILSQTYKNFTFIVIDDGSMDGTWQVIRSFKDKRIKAIHHEECGYLTKRLNEGLRMTTTEFVARMDSHNIADETRLEKQRDFLLKNKNIALVGSNFIRQDENGKIISRSNFSSTWEEIENKIMEKNLFKHASWFARYDILKKEGFYNETFRFSQDYEFLLRLIPKYPVAILPDYLLTEIQIMRAMSQTHRFEQALLALRAQIQSLKWYPKWQIIYLLRTTGFIVKALLYKPQNQFQV